MYFIFKNYLVLVFFFPLKWDLLFTRLSGKNCNFLTRSLRTYIVQLACVKHAFSVHPEPYSVSVKKSKRQTNLLYIVTYSITEQFPVWY